MENRSTEAVGAQDAKVSEVLRAGARCLLANGIESATLDAEVLLGHALNRTRERLVLTAADTVIPSQLSHYEYLLARRCAREPVPYITGRREFWSLDFRVTPAVLIPRPETEFLVETTLELAREMRIAPPLRILDIGTGSGAIAVALATELTSAEFVATDNSAVALGVAAENVAINGVATKIELIHSDLFSGLQVNQRFDLVVSNPPYLRRDEIDTLEPEVSRWEPRAALDGGADGLDYYRCIAVSAFDYLRPTGAVAVEIGAGTGEEVTEIFAAGASWADIARYRDYAGIERVVVARKCV